jgi:hypothetical protein
VTALPAAARNSIRPTYDSRETGPRYHVTVRIGDETVLFRRRVPDPFVRQSVIIDWRPWKWLPWPRRKVTVTVIVDGDPDVVNDVLELDADTLVPGSTRQAAFRSHLNEAMARFVSEDPA